MVEPRNYDRHRSELRRRYLSNVESKEKPVGTEGVDHLA